MAEIVTLKSKAERYYKKGNNASYAGNYPDAVYYFKQAIDEDRRNKLYFIDLISVFNQIGFYEESATYCSEALSLDDLDPADKSAIYFYFGEACYCLGLNEASKKYIDLCLEQDVDSLFYKDALLYKNELDKISEQYNLSDNEAYERNFSSKMQDDIDIDALESEASYNLSQYNYLDAYFNAEKILSVDPGNISAMVIGYEASKMLKNQIAERKYSSLLRHITDCTDRDLRALCYYFTMNSDDDLLAKEVFASIYNSNTFWKDSNFALAASFYNNGEINAAMGLFERLNKLEGGDGPASLYLKSITSGDKPDRIHYFYAPCVEQMGSVYREFVQLAQSNDKDYESYRILMLDLTIILRYGNPVGLGEIISVLDVSDMQIKAIIKQILHRYNVDPSKKLILALYLWEHEPDEDTEVNIMGDRVKLADLASRFKMRNFDVPYALEEEFGREAVAEVYYSLPSLGIVDMDATDSEFAFIANILLLLSKGETPDLQHLAKKYGLETEDAIKIEQLMKKKGLLVYE